jgi:hypothetical protein
MDIDLDRRIANERSRLTRNLERILIQDGLPRQIAPKRALEWKQEVPSGLASIRRPTRSARATDGSRSVTRGATTYRPRLRAGAPYGRVTPPTWPEGDAPARNAAD